MYTCPHSLGSQNLHIMSSSCSEPPETQPCLVWGTSLHITFQDRADLPDTSSSFSVELPESQLHVEEGHPSNNHEEQVGHQEGTCAEDSSFNLEATEGAVFIICMWVSMSHPQV